MYKKITIIIGFFLISLFSYGQNDHKNRKSLPTFPGGDDSLKSFIIKNLKWPGPDWCGEGIVKVRLRINNRGEIINYKILRSIDEYSDMEVIRLIKLMPNWEIQKQKMLLKHRIDLLVPFRLEQIGIKKTFTKTMEIPSQI